MYLLRFLLPLFAATLISSNAMAEPTMYVHKTIFLCSEEASIFQAFKAVLPDDLSLIDGRTAEPPANWSEITLAVVGRHDGAAAQCARQHPKGAAILELVRVDGELGYIAFKKRMKEQFGDKLVRMGAMKQSNDRDKGPIASWFADLCFVEPSEPCDLEEPEIFMQYITEQPPF